MSQLKFLNENHKQFSDKGVSKLMVDVRCWGEHIGELRYKSCSLSSMWKLIAFVIPHSNNFVFEIKNSASNFSLYCGYKEGMFFLFFDDCSGHSLTVFSSSNDRSIEEPYEVVEFYDGGQELVYFLPCCCSMNFEEMVMLGTQLLLTEDISKGIRFSQAGEKVLELYNKMAQEYGL